MGEILKKNEENKYGFQKDTIVEDTNKVEVVTTKKFSWKQIWNNIVSCMNIRK